MKCLKNPYFVLLFVIIIVVLSEQSEACCKKRCGYYKIAKTNPTPKPTPIPTIHPRAYLSIKQVSTNHKPNVNNLAKPPTDDEQYYKLLMNFAKPKSSKKSAKIVKKSNSSFHLNNTHNKMTILDKSKGFTQNATGYTPKRTTSGYPVAPIPNQILYPTVPISDSINNGQKPCLTCQHHQYNNGNGHVYHVFNNGIHHHHHYDPKMIEKENGNSNPLTPKTGNDNFNNGLKPYPERMDFKYQNDVNLNK